MGVTAPVDAGEVDGEGGGVVDGCFVGGAEAGCFWFELVSVPHGPVTGVGAWIGSRVYGLIGVRRTYLQHREM